MKGLAAAEGIEISKRAEAEEEEADVQMLVFGLIGLAPLLGLIFGFLPLFYIPRCQKENGGKLSKKGIAGLSIGLSSVLIQLLLLAVFWHY